MCWFRNSNRIKKLGENPNFFYNNNTTEKTAKNISFKPCSMNRMKTINILTNITYKSITEEDFSTKKFTSTSIFCWLKIWTHSWLNVKYKIKQVKKCSLFYGPNVFLIKVFQHICKNENFIYLNGKNLLYPKSSEIFWIWIEENVDNYKFLIDI